MDLLKIALDLDLTSDTVYRQNGGVRRICSSLSYFYACHNLFLIHGKMERKETQYEPYRCYQIDNS